MQVETPQEQGSANEEDVKQVWRKSGGEQNTRGTSHFTHLSLFLAS